MQYLYIFGRLFFQIFSIICKRNLNVYLSYDVASGSEITSYNKMYLSYDLASGSEITSCNKIDKPLVVNRFQEDVMTAIQRCLHNDIIITFLQQK